MHARSSARPLRTFIVALLVAATALSLGGPASAAAGACAGRGVPDSKIGVQLFTLRSVIASQGLDKVFSGLSEIGYRNVELYSLHGLTATQMAALLKKHGLKATSTHTSINESTWNQTLADAKTLGLKWLGAGSTPRNYTTAQQWLDYAALLNRLGERAQKRGLTLLVHNHNWEFSQVYNGKSAYQILLENTDPRYVDFELDLYWAVVGGADPVALLERYGNRIELLHVKDRVFRSDGSSTFADVGSGNIDFARIFDAADGRVKEFIVERDDAGAQALTSVENSFDYLDCLTY